tara:strand:+ start:274 stop:840 length:567 start_codon:yes stop_codon:yes gene_type:complete
MNSRIYETSIVRDSEDIRVIPWARYFARMFDLIFICFIFVLPLNILGIKVNYTIIEFLIIMPFNSIFFEPFCYSLLGTTPGKFLYSIKVLNNNGSKLSLKKALKRSLQVWIRGNGFNITLIVAITNFVSYRYYQKNKETPWDRNLNINYQIGTISNSRIIITNIIIFLIGFSLNYISNLSKYDYLIRG